MVTLTQTAPPMQPMAQTMRDLRADILAIANRMFNEGFKKSVIIRITGLSEEEYIRMIKEFHCGGGAIA